MYFFAVLLSSFLFPFFFMKATNKWMKWLPSLLFLILSLFLAIKVLFFPAPEMAILGDIIYLMSFVVAVIGSILGILFLKWLDYHLRKIS